MRQFAYHRPTDSDGLEAILASLQPEGPPTSSRAQFIAGGTTILDLMKLDAAHPEALIDINAIENLAGSKPAPRGYASARSPGWRTSPVIRSWRANIR